MSARLPSSAQPHPHYAPPYRADVQSLRALAVALVVAAHAGVPGLGGGFVGVDVFFVLSGFLISALVLGEYETRGSFDVLGFYARRLKRLLPALLLMLLGSASLAWLIGPPAVQAWNASAATAASLWLSNLWFAARVVNYFSAGVDTNWFLHTWSLGVEEQFYLAWPWLLLLFGGALRRRRAASDRRGPAAGLVLIGVASFVLCLYWSRTDLNAAFYLMPARAWEFALGACAMLAARGCERGDLPALDALRGNGLLAGGGLVLILGAALCFGIGAQLRYPGAWAAVPALGAAMLLLDAPARNPRAPLSRVLLGVPLLRHLGDVSYSLYLWHWPVLKLGRLALGDSAAATALLIVVSLLLAEASWRLVEQPLRSLRARRLFVLLPSAAAMTVAFVLLGAWHDAAQARMRQPQQREFLAAQFDVPVLYADGCDSWWHSDQVSECVFGPRDASHTVVMFGDSVLAQWFPAVARIYLRRPGWKLVVVTKSACPASAVSYYYPRIHQVFRVCDRWRLRALHSIAAMHADLVFMGSTHYDFTDALWTRGTRLALQVLAPASRQVVIVAPPPELGFDAPECLSQRAAWPRWLPGRPMCARALAPHRARPVLDDLRRAAAAFPNVRVLDMDSAICPQRRCRAEVDGHVAWRDGQHLTASYVARLAAALRHRLAAIGAA